MKLKIFIILASVVLLFTNCNDVLDRPSLTTAEDGTTWHRPVGRGSCPRPRFYVRGARTRLGCRGAPRVI